jgi:spermidine synthase
MEKHMSVDGIVIGGTGFSEFKQLLLAHLPKLLLNKVSPELSVGLGSGILAGESARHAGVEKITVVEIEPSVAEGARWFANENHDVLENPQVSVIIDDIGNYLRTTDNIYQVITADEKTADEYASNGFSYSLDYYRLLRDHLAPGGLVAQWVPTTLPPEQYRTVLKTFSQSFPHMQLWYFVPAYKRGPFNSILIGSRQPIELDYDEFNRRLRADKAAFRSLVPFGLTSAEAILPHFVADETVLRDALKSAFTNSLDHPRYEFFYPWDYAINRQMKFVANHEFIREIKREASAGFLAGTARDTRDAARLRQSIAGEDRYLFAFQKFLTGIPLSELYRLFDDTLSLAPWNDSLRAQVYSLYSYIASAQSDSMMRKSLMKRADALYPAARED